MKNLDSVSVFKVVKVSGAFKLQSVNGEIVGTAGINTGTRRKAFDTDKALK